MKKILALLSVIVLMASCNKTDGYTISGKVKNVENGTIVYIKNQSENSIVTTDSTEVINGKFEFKGPNIEPILSYIFVGKNSTEIPFVLENGIIDVFYDSNDIDNSKVSGTKNNKFLNAINDEYDIIDKKVEEFKQKNHTVFMEAQQTDDKVVIDSLINVLKGFSNEKNKLFLSFVEKDKDGSYISLLIIKDLLLSKIIEPTEAENLFNKMSLEIKDLKEGKELSKIFQEEKNTNEKYESSF